MTAGPSARGLNDSALVKAGLCDRASKRHERREDARAKLRANEFLMGEQACRVTKREAPVYWSRKGSRCHHRRNLVRL
jgi:hypothetical protein